MANKRDSSRQKRARQNRAQRAALEARTQGKAPGRPSRVAPSTAEKLQRSAEERPSGSAGSKGAAKGSARSGSGADGTKKRAKRERPPRPGDVPVDVTTLEGSWFSRMTHVPGGTQALFAGVMAVVATGLVAFTKSFISEADQEELGNDAKATQTIFEHYDPAVSIPLVVFPLLIAGLAVAASFHPQRRRIWLGAAAVLGLLSVSVLPFLLFVAGFFIYAVFRASKVEGRDKPMVQVLLDRRRAARGGTAADDDHDDDLSDGPDDGADETGEPADSEVD